jgi:hypothetical protein
VGTRCGAADILTKGDQIRPRSRAYATLHRCCAALVREPLDERLFAVPLTRRRTRFDDPTTLKKTLIALQGEKTLVDTAMKQLLRARRLPVLRSSCVWNPISIT